MDVRNSAKPGCKRHNAGAKAGTPVPAAESKPLAPMGTCIGANGGFCCWEPAPAFCPAGRALLFRHVYPSVFCIFKGS